MAPPDAPFSRTRAERFDDLVLDAVERLDRSWEQQLSAVEVAVEEVPTGENPHATVAAERVPLGRFFPRTKDHPARIVVYRRPIEARAPEERDLALLVHDIVVEQVAELLGIEPGAVDPGYHDREL